MLQQQGFGSRKGCQQLIRAGVVALDGIVRLDPEEMIEPASCHRLTIAQQDYPVLSLPLYILLYKPAGYEVSHNPGLYPAVFSLLPMQMQRIGLEAVGRLDVDTTGLLLFSSNGQFVHALTSPRRHVPKRYRVTVKHSLTAAMAIALRAGVMLNGDPDPAVAQSVEICSERVLTMVIDEGRYHQVKRMLAAVGNRVEALHREAIGALELDVLSVGQWRYLTLDEVAQFGF